MDGHKENRSRDETGSKEYTEKQKREETRDGGETGQTTGG